MGHTAGVTEEDSLVDSLEVPAEESRVATVGTTGVLAEDFLTATATSVDMEADSGGQEAMVVQAVQVVQEAQVVVQDKGSTITQVPKSTLTSTCLRSRSQTSLSSSTMGKTVA